LIQKTREGKFFVVRFPIESRNPKAYMGAAHGSFGVLYLLMIAHSTCPEDLNLRGTIRDTIDELAKFQNSWGNFPARF